MEHVATPAAAAAAHRSHTKEYFIVFGVLALLTAIEVGVAFIGLSRAMTIIALLALAVWKALLVALYYMHLRYEPKRLHLLVISPLPLIVILLVAVLTEY